MKRKKLSKIIAVLLCIILSVPAFMLPASAVDVTSALTSLKTTFAAGKYWNHDPSSSNNPASVRTVGCTHHDVCNVSTGSCGCNFFGRGIQCHGFGLYMAYRVYGTYPDVTTNKNLYTNGQVVNGNWTLYKAGGVSQLQPGDVVRKDGHTAIVWSVSGSTVQFAEAWGGVQCKIAWGGFNGSINNMNSIINSMDFVVRNVQPTVTVTVTFNANGGYTSTTSKTVTVGGTYGALPTPTRNGYSFTGWYKSNGTRIYSGSTVTEENNHTLYAHWRSNSYK